MRLSMGLMNIRGGYGAVFGIGRMLSDVGLEGRALIGGFVYNMGG